MTPAIALIAGKCPSRELGGGHGSYVRCHARAARQGGFPTVVYSVEVEAREKEFDWGLAVHLPSPLFHQDRFGPFRARWDITPVVARRAGGLLAADLFRRFPERPLVLHGFGKWNAIAVSARRELRNAGSGPVASVASAYTDRGHELRAKIRGANADHGWPQRLRPRLEYLWYLAAGQRTERKAYRTAQRILVNYNSVAAALRAHHPKLPPITKLPYTVESAFDGPPAPRSEHPGPALLITISRHDPRKGLDDFLHAIRIVRDRHPELAFTVTMLGRGPLLEAHRRLAGKLGLDRIVQLPGYVEDAESLLREADIFLLPSTQEGSGSVSLLEAMRLGVPAVATCIDGIPEDITHGESGWLIPPANRPALAEAIAHLLLDSALRRRIGEGGRHRFAAAFTPEALVGALGEVYRCAINASTPASVETA